MTYVDDVVDAFVRLGASDLTGDDVFNLGGTAPVSLREIGSRIVVVAGGGSVQAVPWLTNRKAIDIGSYYADYS